MNLGRIKKSSARRAGLALYIALLYGTVFMPIGRRFVVNASQISLGAVPTAWQLLVTTLFPSLAGTANLLSILLLGEAIANLSRHVHVNLVPEAAVVNDGRQYATCGYMVVIRDIARATVGRHCVAYG